MKTCDYILVTVYSDGLCRFKPYYKQNLENFLNDNEIKLEDCVFIDDFEELDTDEIHFKDELQKYIIIKGEIVKPKEVKIQTVLKL